MQSSDSPAQNHRTDHLNVPQKPEPVGRPGEVSVRSAVSWSGESSWEKEIHVHTCPQVREEQEPLPVSSLWVSVSQSRGFQLAGRVSVEVKVM